MDSDLRVAGWLTTRQAAEELGVSPAYVYRLVHLQLLFPRRFAGRRLYRVEDIRQYQATHPRLGRLRVS